MYGLRLRVQGFSDAGVANVFSKLLLKGDSYEV